MYTTLSDFHADIEKSILLLSMTSLLKGFSGIHNFDKYFHNNTDQEVTVNAQQTTITNTEQTKLDIKDIKDNLIALQESAKNNHSNLVVLNGTLLLFIVGRFESFIRETFEECCKNIVLRAKKFSHLPKEMKENVIRYTSEVISNPRKYGHSDNGVKSFVRVLSKNLADDDDLIEINHQCLSITHENMRPEILSDLFKRVGVKNIWEKISQQSQLQVFFETGDASYARSQSETFLNTLMDRRNSIAHPSRSITWPDVDYILKVLDFFKTLSSVIITSLDAIEFEIQQRIISSENNQKRA